MNFFDLITHCRESENSTTHTHKSIVHQKKRREKTYTLKDFNMSRASAVQNKKLRRAEHA